MQKTTTLKKQAFRTGSIIRKLFAGWMTAAALEYWLLPKELRGLGSLAGLKEMSLIWMLGTTVVAALILFGVSLTVDTAKIERWIVVGSTGMLVLGALLFSYTRPMLVVGLLIAAALVVYGIWGWNKKSDRPPERITKTHRVSPWIVAAMALGFFLFVSTWLVARVRSLTTPAFDFGIFAQMFHYMSKTGLPLTTMERDGLLSHFAVHVSPIYYLMLPFYWIFPTPATLQVLQAAILASAVIPLWKLAKLHGLTDVQSILLCAVLLLMPAYAGGTSYDLHENCFLAPLLLWLFYGIDSGSIPITAVSGVLTLMVKEDAAVYVAVIALWLILKSALRYKKSELQNLLTGIALLAGSLVWFFLVTGYLSRNGDGVMAYRYKNFMFNESDSLITVIIAVFLSPMKALYESVEPEKLKYISMTLLPLLGLPLITRRFERYLLLIPYLLVNLMTDYPYQFDIFFQYGFGSTVFLIYLTLVNLKDLKINWVRVAALGLSAVLALSFFHDTVYPKAARYPKQAKTYAQKHENIRQLLDTIPENASVTAHTFYVTPLSDRDVIYDLGNCSRDTIASCEYVVLNPSYGDSELRLFRVPQVNTRYENLLAFLEENGFVLVDSYDKYVAIYRKAAP